MEARHALIAALAIVLAGLSGGAIAGDDPVRCEERCEERLAECESEAETRYDECVREPREVELECACSADVVAEDPPPHCRKQCVAARKALDACDAKREKRRDKCVDRRDRCAGNCG